MDNNESKLGWKCFRDLMLSVKNESTFNELAELLFTIEERGDIATRCLIVKALQEGKLSQRDMSDELSVSIAKITRGSNALKIISPTLKQYLLKEFKVSSKDNR